MKNHIKCLLKVKLYGAIILIFSSIINMSYAQTEIKPNLEPGRVYHLDELPNSWFNFYYNARSFWGKNVLITWVSLDSCDFLYPLPTGENSLFVDMNGQMDLTYDNKKFELQAMDGLYLDKDSLIPATTNKASAELLGIFWPINIGHVGTQDAPGKKIIAPKALPPSSIPTVTPGEVFNFNDNQFCKLSSDVYARIVQFSRAQLCHLRIVPEGKFKPADYDGEVFLFIIRGSIQKSDGDTWNISQNMTQMSKYDVMYLLGNTADTFTAGPYGCEVLALFTPSRPELTRALEESREKFNSIIAPNTQPKLIIDAKRDNLDLSGGEGPSWINGKLYFVGFKLHVLNRDGSCIKLNDDCEIASTFPLPNGNIAACLQSKKKIIEISPSGKIVRTIVDSYEGEELLSGPNDLVIDKKGGIYCTLMGEKHTGVLYLNSNGKLLKVTEWDKYLMPNGCNLSPDGTRFYLNTSIDNKIWEFDVEADGSLSNGRLFARTFHLCPDGLKIDASGNLYVVTRIGIEIYDPDGNFIGFLKIPQTLPSNCAFGGDDMSTLYITTQRGQVYSIQTKTKGVKYPIR
jgi:gluconolactonase